MIVIDREGLNMLLSFIDISYLYKYWEVMRFYLPLMAFSFSNVSTVYSILYLLLDEDYSESFSAIKCIGFDTDSVNPDLSFYLNETFPNPAV